MTQLINRFVYHFIEEAVKKQSLSVLYDADLNKACYEIDSNPVSIKPKVLEQNIIPGRLSQSLYVYPSKQDSEEYLRKTEQLIEAIHGISNYAVFEIRGNKDQIVCCFYADDADIEIINSSVRNFYPNAMTEKTEINSVLAESYVYDFLPNSAFFKSLTTYNDFVISPLNLIPMILLGIDENSIGVYQVLIKPLGGEMHSMVEEAIDCEWKTMQGADNKLVPSLQGGFINEKLSYKSLEFHNYFSICIRLILPTDIHLEKVKAFISSFTYGNMAFNILDNSNYSQDQINEMLINKVSYHSGFVVNSHELTSPCHVPYQILDDKEFTDKFAIVPPGDKPLRTTEYKDISIGTWACGNSSQEIHLPMQREIPHVHVLGVSRAGKSVLLSHIAIEKIKRKEAVIISDPHGDLVSNILRMVPKRMIDKVVVIDFGLEDATPQITIRGNLDLTDPSKVSDDMTDAMKDVASTRDKFWGPKMAYYFSCLYYIYSVCPDLNLTDIKMLISRTKKAGVLREKVKAKIKHPVVKEFL